MNKCWKEEIFCHFSQNHFEKKKKRNTDRRQVREKSSKNLSLVLLCCHFIYTTCLHVCNQLVVNIFFNILFFQQDFVGILMYHSLTVIEIGFCSAFLLLNSFTHCNVNLGSCVLWFYVRLHFKLSTGIFKKISKESFLLQLYSCWTCQIFLGLSKTITFPFLHSYKR